MKFNQTINNFSSGEWSPKMRARSESQQYANACQDLENFMPILQGGVRRRPPTTKVILDSGGNTDIQTAANALVDAAKLIPYVTADGARKVLFFNNLAPSVNGFWLDSDGPSAGTHTFTVDTFADFAVTARDIRSTQCGDLLFMSQHSTSTGAPPRVLYPGININLFRRYQTANNWLSTPYLPINANGTSVNLTAGAGTGNTTLTASAAYFDAGMVGSFFKLSAAGSTGVVLVATFTSSTILQVSVVTASVTTATCGTDAGTSWEEGAWSDYRGWPRYVTAFQGRLIFAGSKSFPDTVWGSRIGNVFDFMERPFEQDDEFDTYTSNNSRPFTLAPNTAKSGTIRGISAAKTLLIHTDQVEIVAYGTQGALGPNDVTFESSTSFGAEMVEPTRTNNYALFVQKGGRKVRDVIFDFDQGQYKSSDLGFTSEHLTLDGTDLDPITQIIDLKWDTSYTIARTLNGRMLSLALDRDYQLTGWSSINLGGNYLQLSPQVRAAVAVESSQGGDRLFLLVLRTLNGAPTMCLEYMNPPLELEDEGQNGAADGPINFYADYRRNYVADGSLTLDLVGKTVDVLADDEYIGQKVVGASGLISLGATYTHVNVGLPYESKLIPMPLELGQQIPGTSQALFKRVDEITIRFFNSRGCRYGKSEADLVDIDFKDPSLAMNARALMFSGSKTLKYGGNYDRECQPVIVQNKPWPCTVICVVAKGVTYD